MSLQSSSLRYGQYRFPPSPPSSGTPTADSSPRIPSQNQFLFTPNYRSTATRSVSRHKGHDEDTSDSEGYTTERLPPGSMSRKRPRRRQTLRSLTMPVVPKHSPTKHRIHPPSPTSPRQLSRSPSSGSVSSTSTDTSRDDNHHPPPPLPPPPPPPHHTGRKVAATLQLFKETASDEMMSTDPSDRTDTVDNELTEPQYQFVKRSEWPDRETAAGRREKSMSSFAERSRTRDPVLDEISDNRRATVADPEPFHQWRSAVTDRGRRRDRPSEDLLPEGDLLVESPASFRYPPSPSPSRSPTKYISATFDLPIDLSLSPLSPSPATPSPALPPSPLESAWSTDDEDEDESTWETASAVSTSSSVAYDDHVKTSPHASDSELPTLHPDDIEGPFDDDRPTRPKRRVLPEKQLPHIPLRPFRNQVGGHSAIYRFTKQAVCKVSMLGFFFSLCG